MTDTTVKQTQAEKLNAKATTLRELIIVKTGEYNSILAQLEAIALVANVTQGDTVTATSGKGEKAINVTGVVLGVAVDEDGAKKVKVQTGSGFDTVVYVFNQSQITAVVPAVTLVDLEAQDSDEAVEMPEQTPEFDAQYTVN